MRSITSLLAGAMLATTTTTAGANVIVLDFEGISTSYPYSDTPYILDFYNGGTSSAGTSGTNYGVSFDDNAVALCLNTPGDICSNTSRGGLAPLSATGSFILAGDGESVLDIAAGFDTALSFYYAQPDPFQQPAAVYVYEGLGGTGNLLALLDLSYTSSSCDYALFGADYCPLEVASLGFAGIARSVVFEGTADFTVFDDVTLGSATPGNNGDGGPVTPGIPEPATWVMLIAGFGLVGLSARRRRRARI